VRADVVGAHAHSGAAVDALGVALLIPVATALVLYLGAVVVSARRGRAWPWYRTLCGVAGIGAGAVGILVALAPGGFVAHMVAHVLVGMVAPLLLVLAAPVTLALRTLDVVPARRLSRMLSSPPARLLTHPVVAAVLNVGSLWLLYRTPLFSLAHADPLLHGIVLVHFLLAGYLFTVALVPVDPAPHRSSFALRATVLVLSVAAHGILAKTLVAAPPPGVDAIAAEAGARVMFSSGDLVELAIAALLCAEAYRAAGRRTDVRSVRPSGAVGIRAVTRGEAS
jgi:putative membrane protein